MTLIRRLHEADLRKFTYRLRHLMRERLTFQSHQQTFNSALASKGKNFTAF